MRSVNKSSNTPKPTTLASSRKNPPPYLPRQTVSGRRWMKLKAQSMNNITRVMSPTFPATPEKNCRECYQYDAGKCYYCDLPVIDVVRCGFFIKSPPGV